LVVLPHTLDEHPDPHGVLREAYRVLRAEGRMIILGFNPLSVWGAQAKYCSWRAGVNSFGIYPSLPHPPIQIGRIKDWIELLNCDVVRGAYGCYAPFVQSERWQARWHWMEDAGDRWWGFAGAVYALMVVKRVYSPTLVGLINEKKSNKKWVAQVATSSIQTSTQINSDNT
jgi:SAM-dependent methyltransferase